MICCVVILMARDIFRILQNGTQGTRRPCDAMSIIFAIYAIGTIATLSSDQLDFLLDRKKTSAKSQAPSVHRVSTYCIEIIVQVCIEKKKPIGILILLQIPFFFANCVKPKCSVYFIQLVCFICYICVVRFTARHFVSISSNLCWKKKRKRNETDCTNSDLLSTSIQWNVMLIIENNPLFFILLNN